MLKLLKKNLHFQNIVILTLINFCVFYNYWIGYSTPPWDFLGGGQVEQFRFYEDGNFFNPPSWFPYAWFGIPEYQLLQDGGWFLPVAFVAEFFIWSPPNAARVQAFLVLFGSVGVYFLSAISLKNKKLILLSGILYQFIPAFYSNAQHYGVVRSAALLPWVLLFLSPKIIFKFKFSIFFGSLIIFQAIVGSYPGNLVSIFYTSIIYVIYNFFEIETNKIKYFLNVLAIALFGSLMGSLRYLPVISNLNSFPSNASNEAGIDFNNVVYMIYPFFGENLPWADPTLRSLYIGPLALISLLFINFKNKKIYLWLLLAFFSIILMMDNFLNDFLRAILPLANISRFGITDWRNTLNLALIMMTILVLNNLTEKNASRNYIRIAASLSITIYFAYLGFTYKFNFIHVLFYVIMILICILLVLKINKKNILNYILLSSFIFGYLFVLDNSYAWSTTVKEQYFNIYRTDYSNIKENIIYPMQHRPKRFFFKEPPLEPDEYKSDQRYNRFWLTGGFGALGYHNIKDIPAYSSLFPRLESNNDKVINFLSSSGRQVILTNPKQIESKLDECTQFYDCNNDASIKVDQLLFLKETEKFKVSSIKEFTLVQNEIYSPVWTGKICFDNKKCQNIKSYASLDSLRSWNLPKGEYIFETNARTPLNTQRWYLFYLGLIFATTHFIFNLFNSSSSSVKNKSISS